MGIFNLFRRQSTDDEAMTERTRLLRAGRIAEGMILDVVNDTSQVLYNYSANGVEYESSQILNAEQLARPHDYAPGSRVTVRFDPRRPGNSTIQ